jgi:hypothetical protein
MLDKIRWDLSLIIIYSNKRSRFWMWLLERLRTKKMTQDDIDWAVRAAHGLGFTESESL